MAGNMFNSMKFIKASSPLQLESLMLQLNLSKGMEHIWHNIQYAEGFWYAFYYTDRRKEVNAALSRKVSKK